MHNIKKLMDKIYEESAVEYESEMKKNKIDLPLSIGEEQHLETIYKLRYPTFSDFASAIKLTKPAATQIIKQYIKKGYVTKVQSEDDRRVYHIVLNQELLALFTLRENIFNHIMNSRFEYLTDENRHILIKILTDVLDTKKM